MTVVTCITVEYSFDSRRKIEEDTNLNPYGGSSINILVLVVVPDAVEPLPAAFPLFRSQILLLLSPVTVSVAAVTVSVAAVAVSVPPVAMPMIMRRVFRATRH